ncbi:MAG: FAD-dependent oxidoreductase [Bradyrhizobiaceae bacterium]|nr:FAD-dependent oxidoreductase [Bradyrhizobiaceae bacterium]
MLNRSEPPSGEVDIAIIGAGAAGIAAARRLADAGADFVVLEARSRIGGRAWTAELAGFPLDLGCGWLHSADRNPWTGIAEKAGFAIDRTPAPWTAGRDLTFTEADQRDFRAAFAAFYGRLDQAAEEGEDRPASVCLAPGGRWNALLDAISTYANGAELDRVSIRDAAQYSDDEVNWRVVEGYGTAVAAHGAGLPVALDCAVTWIDHSGASVRIETSRGTVVAKTAIVTLPTDIIADETVRFMPTLPDKLDAAAGLPLGLADKVLLALDHPESVPAETRLFGWMDRTATGAYHFRPFGRPLVEGYFGGELARVLEHEGEAAFAQYAIDEIAGRFGGDIRARLRPVAATAWARDPHARGSYSYAMPGKAGARAILAQPVNDRLFFAGEACSAESFTTAHGAYETGVAAAESALAGVTRLRSRSR